MLDLCIPPSQATLILDTDVCEEWLVTIADFERRLEAIQARSKVKAARDLEDVAEGLRIAVCLSINDINAAARLVQAAIKIRSFLLGLLQPLRSSVSTNIHVLQTSVLQKYQVLFGFLQRQAAAVAFEVQRAYAASARTYYETGFRRYARIVTHILSRTTERSEPLGQAPASAGETTDVDAERLAHASIDGPAVMLAFQADDRAYVAPPEGLFRSLMLVLLDNCTAEYSFVLAFFARREPALLPLTNGHSVPPQSPRSPFTPADDVLIDEGPTPKPRQYCLVPVNASTSISKEERSVLDAIWKSVMDPAIEYCAAFVRTILTMPPAAVSLLTMIRLNDAVLAETVARGGCGPLVTFFIEQRLAMWPIFQKVMNAHVESLKKVADSAVGGVLTKSSLQDSTVRIVSHPDNCMQVLGDLNVDADCTSICQVALVVCRPLGRRN